jgi:hypothetical protein
MAIILSIQTLAGAGPNVVTGMSLEQAAIPVNHHLQRAIPTLAGNIRAGSQ